MGLSPFSSSVFDRPQVVYVERPTPAGLPNPWRFRVIRAKQVKEHLVVEVAYPDAKNYEGRKIIVYRNTARSVVLDQHALDPHFTVHGPGPKPFARFVPTNEGWTAALALAESL